MCRLCDDDDNDNDDQTFILFAYFILEQKRDNRLEKNKFYLNQRLTEAKIAYISDGSCNKYQKTQRLEDQMNFLFIM